MSKKVELVEDIIFTVYAKYLGIIHVNQGSECA